MDTSRIEELRKCCNDFAYFCEHYVKTLHPKRGLISFKLHDYQKRLLKAYNDERFVIMTKFRNGGFTTFSAIWALWQCIFRLDQQIMITSHRDRDSVEIYKKMVHPVWLNLPEWMCPKLGHDSMHRMEFTETNSSLYFGSLEPVKGRRLDTLIIDEAAFYKKMKDKWRAVWPCMSCGGKCFVNSTTNGVGNWFEETYKNALEGKNAFKVFWSDHTEHPDHTPEWCEETRKDFGEKGWAQEVLQCFVVDDTIP